MAKTKKYVLTLYALLVAFAALFAGAFDRLKTGIHQARMADVPRRLHRGIDGILLAGQAPSTLQWAPRAAKTGTMSIADLRAARFQSVAAFGSNTISEVFQADLEVHRAIVADLLGPLVDFTSDRQRIYGTSDRGAMVETDEYGRAPTQKVTGGVTVAFPLRNYAFPVGWTRKYLKNAKVGELLDQYTGAKKAHALQVARQIKRAMYLSANYTWRDMHVDNVDLAVKRFLNADSAAIPDGPNGEQYDGTTHTHYDAIASITAASLTAAIRDVVEHGNGGTVHVCINIADEATIRALTGFTAYIDPRLSLNANAREATKRLDITRLDNRAIGIFDSAEVWLKPWAIQNYALTFDSTSPNKPLVIRTRDGKAPTLEITAEIDTFPLQAQYMESEFGVAVWNRTNGGVLYFGGGSYTDPTI